jgi:hypothetical protein
LREENLSFNNNYFKLINLDEICCLVTDVVFIDNVDTWVPYIS